MLCVLLPTTKRFHECSVLEQGWSVAEHCSSCLCLQSYQPRGPLTCNLSPPLGEYLGKYGSTEATQSETNLLAGLASAATTDKTHQAI